MCSRCKTPADLQAKVKHLASVVRHALERLDTSKLIGDLGVQFSEFPNGACGDSSVVLGQFLKDHGCGDFYYRNGKRYSEDSFHCHTWLAQGDLIVDI